MLVKFQLHFFPVQTDLSYMGMLYIFKVLNQWKHLIVVSFCGNGYNIYYCSSLGLVDFFMQKYS